MQLQAAQEQGTPSPEIEKFHFFMLACAHLVQYRHKNTITIGTKIHIKGTCRNVAMQFSCFSGSHATFPHDSIPVICAKLK
jgi:hypothetical protein